MTGLERLRVLAREMTEGKPCDELHRINGDDGSNCFGRSCSSCRRGALEKVADLIEREHLREVDDISGRDADAVACVESHVGIAECDRNVEASMDVGDKYAFLHMELGKLLGYDLMGQLDATDEELVEKIGKRLMPEGIEWPRFDDGEPVRFGDDAAAGGPSGKVCRITFYSAGDSGDGTSFVVAVERDDMLFYSPPNPVSERVKRPAPRVLDADGVEIREGDVLYSIETGDSVTVDSIEPGNPWFATTDGTLQHCAKLTHERPVADTWERLEEDAGKEACEYFAHMPCGCETSEMLDETVEKCNEVKARDLVRRAKKLAEAER